MNLKTCKTTNQKNKIHAIPQSNDRDIKIEQMDVDHNDVKYKIKPQKCIPTLQQQNKIPLM